MRTLASRLGSPRWPQTDGVMRMRYYLDIGDGRWESWEGEGGGGNNTIFILLNQEERFSPIAT